MAIADDDFKALLEKEIGWLPEGDGIDRLIEHAEVLKLKSREILIHAGECKPDVYILKEGILRYADMDGDKERTYVFALPGTMFMSRHSFSMNLPSYFQIEACCPVVVYKISRDDFWEIVKSDSRLMLWVLKYAHAELFYLEYKMKNITNGDAKDRFLTILKDRPEIIRLVPQKIIASYLGMTPEYYSYIKRKVMNEYKSK